MSASLPAALPPYPIRPTFNLCTMYTCITPHVKLRDGTFRRLLGGSPAECTTVYQESVRLAGSIVSTRKYPRNPLQTSIVRPSNLLVSRLFKGGRGVGLLPSAFSPHNKAIYRVMAWQSWYSSSNSLTYSNCLAMPTPVTRSKTVLYSPGGSDVAVEAVDKGTVFS